MLARLSLIAGLLLSLCGCNPATALRDPAVDAEIHAVFEKIRSQDPGWAASFAPSVAQTITPEGIAAVRAAIPAEVPRARNPTATTVSRTTSGSFVAAVDEYVYKDRTLVVQTLLQRPPGSEQWAVSGFHVRAASAAEIADNRFSVFGKSVGQYLFLTIVVLSPLLMLAALTKVVRTPGLRRKWLWAILAFAGLLSFQMNWTTGEIAVNYLTLQLIGAGVLRGPSALDPWLLTFTLPVGAILILTGVWANPKRARSRAPAAEGVT